MSAFRLISIDDLSRRPDARREDFEVTANLADSIAEVGLTNAILVRAKPDGRFEIIAGSHRYAACDSLGHREIMCQVVELDDLHAELAMIDENLCRAEVSGALLDRQLARRKEIYVDLHPETRAHVAGAHGSNAAQGNASAKLAPAFTAETAALTGRSERTIQRAVERGEKITPEAANLVQGTPLDRGTYRDELKQVPPTAQVEKVRRDLAAPPRAPVPSASAPKREAPTPAAPEAGDAARRFIAITDDLATIDFEAVASGCALRQRADLQNRCRSFLDRFQALDAALEGRRGA